MLLLLIPAVAMQFTSGFNWGSEDFLAAGDLLFLGGMTYFFAARFVHGRRRQVVIGVLVLAGVALIWAELAVGVLS